MQNIDFCITTLDRYELLDTLLESIFTYYPNAEVTIADQSKEKNAEAYTPYDVTVIPLPYDCGLSVARNKLVTITKNPYKLILEDDFLFTEDTKIEKMVSLMEHYDIVGGGVYRKDYRIPFEFYFEKQGKTLYQVDDGNEWTTKNGIKVKDTGCIMNFALFDSQVFDHILWDERLKVREHQHFFYRARDMRIGFTPEVKVYDTKRKNTPEYKRLKSRDEYWRIALEDLGVTKVQYLSGRVVELEDGKVKRYKVNVV